MDNKITTGVCAKLTKAGAKDINLVVHSYHIGRTSPCVVIENGVNLGITGGYIESLEKMFERAVSKHPGYTVQEKAIIEVSPVNDDEFKDAIRSIEKALGTDAVGQDNSGEAARIEALIDFLRGTASPNVHMRIENLSSLNRRLFSTEDWKDYDEPGKSGAIVVKEQMLTHLYVIEQDGQSWR